MRMDLPRCGMTYCRFYLDGNCMNQTKFEQCELTWYKSLEYKYRWHDLRVDPDNLPPVNPYNSHDEDVLLMVRSETEADSDAECYKGHLNSLEPKKGASDGSDNFWGVPTYESEWCIWGWSYSRRPIVIAWRYIEPFEGGDAE